jgi:uncharacterized membrane protein
MAKRKWSYKEVEEFRKANGSLFYFNREDSNILVPKAFEIGRTVNWANPVTWVFISPIVCFVILKRFL